MVKRIEGLNVKFSVLMSLYNKELPSNLNDCLLSLTKQTTKANEVVLVYDGPISDDLRNVVSKYVTLLNINVHEIASNVGLGNALNFGLSKCKYELIARMDTDDICLTDRFEKQIDFLSKNPGVRLLGTSVIEFDEYGQEREKKLPVNPIKIKKFIKKRNPFNHMSVFFYKSDVIKVGGYKHHLYMEDYNLWIRLIHAGIIATNIEDNTVKVRVGREMIVRRKGKDYIASEFQLFKIKIKCDITGRLEGVSIFLLRSLIRVLPTRILSLIYDKDRRR